MHCRKSLERAAFTAASAATIVLICASASRDARALAGDNNLLPEVCQAVAGLAYTTNEVAAFALAPPLDFPPSAGAYARNWALKLCPPQIVAPPDKAGSNGYMPDAVTATSADLELPEPAINDPNCYATIAQPITKAGYDNFFGIPIFRGNWGGLGTPEVFHFNSGVDVRLFDGKPQDDPATEGDESLADERRTTRNSQGQTAVKLPATVSGSDPTQWQIAYPYPPDWIAVDDAGNTMQISPVEGVPEGFTEVTLTGTNFEAGATVLFDQRPGTKVTVIDNTTLTVLTPAAPAGAVGVTVINPDDQETTLADAWSYRAPVPPPSPQPPGPGPGPAPTPSPNPPASGGGGGGGGAMGLEWLLLIGLLPAIRNSRNRLGRVDYAKSARASEGSTGPERNAALRHELHAGRAARESLLDGGPRRGRRGGRAYL